MVHLSFISHAYIWGGLKPEPLLPEVLAGPWVKVAKALGRPPIVVKGVDHDTKKMSLAAMPYLLEDLDYKTN